MQFQLDAKNLKHFFENEEERGINEPLLVRVASGEPKVFENEPRANRSGTHVVVGPDEMDRFWTIVVLHVSGDIWRPITGWPSTGSEIRRYEETE